MSAATSLKLGPAELDRLHKGAVGLGVALDAEALDRFAAYAAVLDRWRATTNLISCRTAAELVSRHLLDSLAIAWIAAAASSLADLGSGAGLPGVPLAIAAPSRRTILVESRQRRVSFLRDVIRALGLRHVTVHAGRAEDVEIEQATAVDVAVTRAVWSTDDILSAADRWVRGGGLMLAMRAHAQAVPLEKPSRWVIDGQLSYQVPGERLHRIDVYRKSSVSRETSS